jgi:gliding motility-associated-like protein
VIKKAVTYYIIPLFFFVLTSSAQEAVYIAANSVVGLGNEKSVGVFGHFLNDGNVSIPKDGKLYFMGKIFRNSATGKITDTSTRTNSRNGGTVIFRPPTSGYASPGQQIVESNYVDSIDRGAAFAQIIIDNADGIRLVSDIHILQAIQFSRGHVYLNKYNATLGDSLTYAYINGYDNTRFFVTGTEIKGGYVRIKSISANQLVAFPIGISATVYTPMQLKLNSAKTDMLARVFYKVYTNATSGQPETDSLLNATWDVYASKALTSDADVILQNDPSVESNVFKANRGGSYVSQFKSNTWDKMQFFPQPQMPGTITSTFTIANAIMNSRKVTITPKPLYLTKRVGFEKIKRFIPNVFSPNGDGINDDWQVKFLAQYPNCRVEIFNRSGIKLFESRGYNRPWDGTFKGKPVPIATYYYLINLNNDEPPISGYVAVLR